MLSPTRVRRLLTLGLTIAAAAALSVAGASGASADDHQTFPGSKPVWATANNDAGPPPVDADFGGQIQLRIHAPAAAEALAKAVSTPGSPVYRRYISPAAWIGLFSPSPQEYARVVDYVKSYGLTITATPKDRLFVNYRGTAAQLDAAFSAGLRKYSYAHTDVVAPSTAPALPTAVAADVQAVNLSQLRHVTTGTPGTRERQQSDAAPVTLPAPCSAYWTQHSVRLPAVDGQSSFNTVNCGYTGDQFRSAYGAAGSGAGQTIGEVLWESSPTIVQDANRLAAHTGTPPLTTFRQIRPPQQYDQDLCGTSDVIEESIDIESMHGLAPEAGIVYSGAADCLYGIDAAMSVLLDDHLSSVVTNSYSYAGELPIDQVQAQQHQEWLAAAEGVGLYYSSGDDGDNTDLGISATPNYFGTSPWVTAVGGTKSEIGRNGAIELETGWGNAYSSLVRSNGSLTYVPTYPGQYDGGAGGGVSTVFSAPWYQTGVVPSSYSGGMRAVPDIAAEADPNSGLLTGYTAPGSPYVEEVWGGTSLASPIVAAEAVLVQEGAGVTLGFANPTLYALAARQSSAITDVLPVKNDVAGNYSSGPGTFVEFGGQYTSLSVNRGWDSVTGLGSFRIPALAAAVRR